MINSIKLSGLEIGVSPDYAVQQEALPGLMSAPEREPVANIRPGTYPSLARSQPQARTISLPVVMLAPTVAGRRLLYGGLLTAAGNGYPPVPLEFTDDGTTYTYQVHCSGPVVDEYYHRATITAIAFNPVPVES